VGELWLANKYLPKNVKLCIISKKTYEQTSHITHRGPLSHTQQNHRKTAILWMKIKFLSRLMDTVRLATGKNQ
jgi:hypothetical protein